MKSRRTLVIIAIVLGSALHSRADITNRLVPQFVTDLASSAFAKIPRDERKDDEAQFRVAFGFGFLEGFLSPDSWLNPRMPRAIVLGDQAGQTYRRTHPEKVAWVLKEYGYIEVECEGVAVTGHEISQFEPKESTYPGPWQLDSFGASWPVEDEESKSSFPRPLNLRKRVVWVKGFLSPAYDDIGDCTRRFLFTSMSVEKG